MQDKLKNSFLIAAPGIDDAVFSRTLILLLEKSSQGSFGIVINREGTFALSEACKQLGFPPPKTDRLFGWGGPVYPRTAFVLHSLQGDWKSTGFTNVKADIAMTISDDILQAIAVGEGPEKTYPVLGCAMWEAGQLEKELEEGVWLGLQAESKIVFDVPLAERYEAALALIGIDTNSAGNVLSDELGHA